jgi:hypothetical protein
MLLALALGRGGLSTRNLGWLGHAWGTILRPSVQRYRGATVSSDVGKEGAAVDAEEQAIRARGLCFSDDEHLVALARKSGARIICTEDAALFKDVHNPALLSKPRGRVYRTKRHVALLCHHARCQHPPHRTR